MQEPEGGPSYRGAAFSHWLNLVFLAAAGAAGATIDPMIWAAILPAELAVLWALPDVPPFRAAVDKQHKKRSMLAERAFYMDQLWSLSPRAPASLLDRIASLFVENDQDDFDERVIHRDDDYARYVEIQRVVANIEEMRSLPGSRITRMDISRFDGVLNAYLGLLLACRTLAHARHAIDADKLRSELVSVNDEIESSNASLRAVLLERKRLIEGQLARLPKLVATFELLQARTDSIGHQLRNIESQIVTFPATQLSEMLDDIIDRNEILADPLADLAADNEIRSLLTSPSSTLPSPGKRAAQARVGARPLKH